MAMTLRLSADEDEALARMARSMNMSKNLAVATIIDEAMRHDHVEFVRSTTERLMSRYSDLFGRLATA